MAKRIIAAAALLCLTLLLLPAPSSAGSVKELEYSVNSDGSLTITGYSGGGDMLAVPASLGGRTVRGVGESAFAGRTGFRRLYIAEGVSVIGSSAFEGCSDLAELTLPASVITIGERAFAGCGALEYVCLPEKLTVLGAAAFADCREPGMLVVSNPSAASFGAGCFGRAEVFAPETSGARALALAEGLKYSAASLQSEFEYLQSGAGIKITSYTGRAEAVILPGSIDGKAVVALGEGAFSPASGRAASARIIILPDSVRTIGSSAFAGSAALERVRLPGSLEGDILHSTFKGCSALKEVRIPDGVAKIGTEAFMNCSSLRRVILPRSLASIGMAAFRDCAALVRLDVPGGEPECEVRDSLASRVSFAGVRNMVVHTPRPDTWRLDGGRWYPNGASSEYAGYDVVSENCGHFLIETIITPVSCSAEGESRYHCPFCGLGYTERYTKLPHEYVSNGTHDGIESFRCTDCGESYTRYHIEAAVITPVIDRSQPKGAMMSSVKVAFRSEVLIYGIDYTYTEAYSESYERVELTFTGHGQYTGTQKIAYYMSVGEFLPAYSLTVGGASGGGQYFPGEQVVLYPDTPPEGYEVGEWIINGASFMSKSRLAAVLEMPERDVSVTLSFREIPVTEPPETDRPETDSPDTGPPETEPPDTTSDPGDETTEPPYIFPPDGRDYIRRAIIWGGLFTLSLAALITLIALMFKKEKKTDPF